MSEKFLIPALLFSMKYFFDIEREITQQILTSVNLKLHDCRELVSGFIQHVNLLNK